MKKQLKVITVVMVGIVGVWLIATKSKPASNQNLNVQNSNSTNSEASATTLKLTEHEFFPAEFEVNASQTITVELANQGTSEHSLGFATLDFSSSAVPPGETATVRFTTPSTPGRYDFTCEQPGHADLGMRGTMIVK